MLTLLPETRLQLEEVEMAKSEQAAATKERQKYELVEKLLLLKNTSLDDTGVRNYLKELKKKYNV